MPRQTVSFEIHCRYVAGGEFWSIGGVPAADDRGETHHVDLSKLGYAITWRRYVGQIEHLVISVSAPGFFLEELRDMILSASYIP